MNQIEILLNEKNLKNKNDGVFIDIGAFDGIHYSNTFLLEERGWKGLCIEPDPEQYKKLVKNRKCICLPYAIDNKEGISEFLVIKEKGYRSGLVSNYTNDLEKKLSSLFGKNYKKNQNKCEIISVETKTINSILDTYLSGIFKIDVLNIDTEGSEINIIKSISFQKYFISFLLFESHYFSKKSKKIEKNMIEFIESKGFEMIWRGKRDYMYRNRIL